MLIKIKFISFILLGLCFVSQNEAQSQVPTGSFSQQESINRHSFGLGVGKLKEWRTENTSRFYTPNSGIAFYTNYNYQISKLWILQAFVNLDYVTESDLNRTYLNGAYQTTLARRLIKFEENKLFVFGGVSFIDEVNYMTSYANDGNGNYTVNYFNIEKYNTPYASFGIEYSHEVSEKLNLGLRVNNYYDFIGFGRTDFSGSVRFNLKH